MQWRPQKCAAQQESMCVMSAMTLFPCLCRPSASVHLLTVFAGLSECVCVCACVSECPAPCVGVSECPAPCVGEFATDFLKATQWYPAVTKATKQISQILCISLQHVLGVSRRCVFLNHSLEWILKFTVNRDSVEVIYLTKFLMQGQQNRHIVAQSKRITAKPVGLS